MKFISIAPFAATAVLGAKTRLKDFDLASYDSGFYGGYAEAQPAVQSGEVFYED